MPAMEYHLPRGRPPRSESARRQKWPLGIMAFLLLLLGAGLALAPLMTAAAASGQPQFSNGIELATMAEAGASAVLLDSQRHFHLLYTTAGAQQTVNLVYQVVSSDSQSAQVVRQPRTLASQADQILAPTLILDSRGRLHAAWIEAYNGVTTIRHALLEDPTHSGAGSAAPVPLFQTGNAVSALSGGADAQGNVFYTWLDSDSGAPNLAMAEVHDNQTASPRVQLTQTTTSVNFPHLAVYPDGTLAAALLQQEANQGGWDLIIAPFDPSGKSLHAPTLVASNLHPGPLNVLGKDPNTFHFDPLALALDAQGTLHLAWGAILQLSYASGAMQADHSFSIQASALSQSLYNYDQLCLSVGPNTPPQQSNASKAAPIWLAWLQDNNQGGLQADVDQISSQATLLTAPAGLVDKNTTAAVPCPQQDTQGGLYVTWQQFDNNQNYAIFMKTTTLPQNNPFWVALGLNRDAPIQQVIFIVLGSVLLGALATLPNFLTVPVAAGVVRFGKRLHIPRLVLILIGLGMLVAVNIWAQSFLAGNFEIPTPPFIWSIVGGLVPLGLMLFLWFRSRRFPPETLGTIGQLLLASYIGAIILSMPLIYVFTQRQS